MFSPIILSPNMMRGKLVLGIAESMEVEKSRSDFKHQPLQVVLHGDIRTLVENVGNIILICGDRFVVKVQMISGHMVICTCMGLSMISFNLVEFSVLIFERIQIVIAYPVKTLEDSFKERKNIAKISFNHNLVHQDHCMFWVGHLTMKFNNVKVKVYLYLTIIGKHVHVVIMEILIIFGTKNFLDDIERTKYLVGSGHVPAQVELGKESLFLLSFQRSSHWIKKFIVLADLETNKEESILFMKLKSYVIILDLGDRNQRRPYLQLEYIGRVIKQEARGDITGTTYRFCSI